jgi:hypothetical protein
MIVFAFRLVECNSYPAGRMPAAVVVRSNSVPFPVVACLSPPSKPRGDPDVRFLDLLGVRLIICRAPL